MCNTSLHHRPFNGVVDPFSFSTFHLLRTCNRLMLPTPDIESYYNIVREHNNNNTISPPNFSGIHSNLTAPEIYNESEITSLKSPILDVIESIPLSDEDLQITDSNSPRNLHENLDSKEPFFTIGSTETDAQTTVNHGKILMSTDASAAIYKRQASTKGSLGTMPPTTLSSSNNNNKSKNHSINKSSLPTFDYIAPASQTLHAMNDSFPLMDLNRVGIGVALGVGEDSNRSNLLFPSFLHRRPRGEKRPIPDEQKDDKYYERRKRNNEAAKKSRDARKIREDRIAFRAALLEQENSILRAQVMALRDEMQRLRQLMSVAAPLGQQRISSIAT